MKAAAIAISVAVAGTAYAEGTAGMADKAWELGYRPIFCATFAPEREFCTFHIQDEYHLVCEAIGDQAPTCARQDDNKRVRPHVRYAKRLRDEVIAQFESAADIRDMNVFVGAGPRWCGSGKDGVVCAWHARRSTPGYLRVSVFGQRSKRAGVLCRFDTTGKRIEPCVVRVEDAWSDE